MRLIEAELWNICQYKHIKVDFQPGLTALVGPNGSGKTNLISAVYTGITGDFSRFELSRQGIISQFAEKDSKAGIRVLMEHHGVKAEITRWLNPVGRSLVIGNEKPITADKAIAERIEKWFGMPIKAMGQYIFVNQWQMFSLLNETAADKAKDLYRLFNLQKAEKCYTSINEFLTNAVEDKQVIDLDAVRSRLMDNRLRLRELDKRHKVLNARVPSQIDRWNMAKLVDEWESSKYLEEEIAHATSAVETNRERAKHFSGVVTILNEATVRNQAEVEKRQKEYNNISARAAGWEAYQKVEENKNRIIKDIKDMAARVWYFEKELAKYLPLKPTNYITDIRSAERTLLEHKLKLERLDKAIAELSQAAYSECPTCRSRIEDTEELVGKYEVEASDLVTQIEELSSVINKSKSYDNHVSKLKWDIQDGKTSIGRSEVALANLPNIDQPDVSKEAFHDAYQAYIEAGKALSAVTQNRAVQERSKFYYDCQVESLTKDLNNKKAKYDQIQSTKDQVEKARTILDSSAEDADNLAKLTAELSVLRRSVTDDEKTITENEDLMRRIAKQKEWRDKLVPTRDILHRDALPRLVAQSYLEKLETQMNSTLQEFNVDFKVRSQDGLKFEVIFNDGIRTLPAEALSGGEKVVFALAWRLAVNSEFASDIGVLCMDEPTAGLDKDRLNCLKTAIGKMRNMSASSGLQCLVITHAEELMPLFDHVIQLQPPTSQGSAK